MRISIIIRQSAESLPPQKHIFLHFWAEFSASEAPGYLKRTAPDTICYLICGLPDGRTLNNAYWKTTMTTVYSCQSTPRSYL